MYAHLLFILFNGKTLYFTENYVCQKKLSCTHFLFCPLIDKAQNVINFEKCSWIVFYRVLSFEKKCLMGVLILRFILFLFYYPSPCELPHTFQFGENTLVSLHQNHSDTKKKLSGFTSFNEFY